MKIGLIGTGGRSLAYLPLIHQLKDTALVAVCDIDPEKLEAYRAQWLADQPEVALHTDYRALLNDETIDTVLILTPDTTHRPIVEAAIARSKHILLEKPIATTVEDAAAIYTAGRMYPKTFALGFVLRYTPVYQTVKQLLAQGRVGEIVTLSAREMLDTRHAASFYRRWHRFQKNNGGLMNAKCSHDLDILNWLVGSVPSHVSAFGGNRVFVADPTTPRRCSQCPRTQTCLYTFHTAYYRDNFKGFDSLEDLCVYNADKDIVDHECMLLRYENGVVAQFELCMLGHEENRTLTVHGTKATMTVDFLKQEIRLLPLNSHVTRHEPELVTCPAPQTGHGGGDRAIMDGLWQSVHGAAAINHAADGFYATAAALAGEESMRTKETVSIKSWLRPLGLEAPSQL